MSTPLAGGSRQRRDFDGTNAAPLQTGRHVFAPGCPLTSPTSTSIPPIQLVLASVSSGRYRRLGSPGPTAYDLAQNRAGRPSTSRSIRHLQPAAGAIGLTRRSIIDLTGLYRSTNGEAAGPPSLDAAMDRSEGNDAGAISPSQPNTAYVPRSTRSTTSAPTARWRSTASTHCGEATWTSCPPEPGSSGAWIHNANLVIAGGYPAWCSRDELVNRLNGSTSISNSPSRSSPRRHDAHLLVARRRGSPCQLEPNLAITQFITGPSHANAISHGRQQTRHRCGRPASWRDRWGTGFPSLSPNATNWLGPGGQHSSASRRQLTSFLGRGRSSTTPSSLARGARTREHPGCGGTSLWKNPALHPEIRRGRPHSEPASISAARAFAASDTTAALRVRNRTGRVRATTAAATGTDRARRRHLRGPPDLASSDQSAPLYSTMVGFSNTPLLARLRTTNLHSRLDLDDSSHPWSPPQHHRLDPTTQRPLVRQRIASGGTSWRGRHWRQMGRPTYMPNVVVTDVPSQGPNGVALPRTLRLRISTGSTRPRHVVPAARR